MGHNSLASCLQRLPSLLQPTVPPVIPMDPGTIIAVVTASAKVSSLITKYYLDVKDAKEDRDRLYKEVEALHHVLQKVKELVEGPNANKAPHLTSYVKECWPDITDLETKLDPGKRGKVMKKLGGLALRWPFDKREVDKYISTFERLKNTINVTLNLDQT
jgi:hypothetical protein